MKKRAAGPFFSVNGKPNNALTVNSTPIVIAGLGKPPHCSYITIPYQDDFPLLCESKLGPVTGGKIYKLVRKPILIASWNAADLTVITVFLGDKKNETLPGGT